MANVMPDVGAFSCTYKDDDGANSTVTWYAQLPTLNQWTHDSAKAYLDEMIDLIAGIVDSAIVGFGFSLTGYDDTFPVATAGSDVEDKAVFIGRTDNNRPVSLSLPSVMESVLVTAGLEAGIQLDTTIQAVSDFIDALETGIDLNPFGFADVARACSSRGENWNSVVDAYKQNRASFKSRRSRG